MKSRQTWHRVRAPLKWRGKQGDELVGTYVSSETRSGQWGEYRVHLVKSRGRVFTVSGTTLNDLFALVPIGTKVKLVYTGNKVSPTSGHEYKTYELYTEEAVEFRIAEVG